MFHEFDVFKIKPYIIVPWDFFYAIVFKCMWFSHLLDFHVQCFVGPVTMSQISLHQVAVLGHQMILSLW